MQSRATYIAGAYLGSVQAALTGLQPEQRAAVQYLCGVSVRETSAATAPLPQIHALIAQVAVGILQRGCPTLSSPRVERALIATLDDASGIAIIEKEGAAVAFDTAFPRLSKPAWRSRILRAHLPFDARTHPDEQFLEAGSAEESRFFTECAPRALGPVAAFLEPQRPFGSMVPGDTGQRRVDFAIESPGGTRIVVEIDGEQHQHSPQRDIDEDRDRRLAKSGWHIVRIATADLHEDRFAPVAAALGAYLDEDKYLRSLAAKAEGEKRETGADRAAFRLVVAPHAIARIQLGILRAIARGALQLDAREWRIGVIERDLPCAHLAVADLLDLMGHLCALYGVDFQPAVRLDCYAAYPRHRHFTPVVEPPAFGRIAIGDNGDWQAARVNPMDTLIDVSVLAHSTATYGDDAQIARHAASARFAAQLRTAHRLHPHEAPQWHAPVPVASCDEANVTYFLQTIFRKRKLRDGQLPIIARALIRRDVIGLLPTGAGKSVTFQLPALLTPGFAVVIDPLTALIQDQMENLTAAGIDVTAAWRSELTEEERRASDATFASGDARFIFIAPERLQMRRFRNTLRQQCIARPVSYIVIDEAHCVSEWGHDFRTAYLNIGRLGRDLCRFRGTEPPLLALTGTASRIVLADMQREIAVEDPEAVVMTDSFDRPNLNFRIEREPSSSKGLALTGLLQAIPAELNIPVADFFAGAYGGLVFCPYVNGPFGITAVAKKIREALSDRNVEVAVFSGAAPRDLDVSARAWGGQKVSVLQRFKADEIPLVVATKAFGMGIDKPNIRYTIHYGIPGSLEAFYQEAGRAGRDSDKDEQAICAVIFSDDDAVASREFLDANMPAAAAKQRYERVGNAQRGDASREMFFITNSFKGADVECANTAQLFRESLQPIWAAHQLQPGDRAELTIPYPDHDGERADIERAIYRLLLLGVLVDYTVDYSNRRFEVTTQRATPELVRANLDAYVLRYRGQDYLTALDAHLRASTIEDPYDRHIDALTWFVYEEIEKKRRTALRNIVEVMRDARGGEDIRRDLVAYLEETAFTQRLGEIVRRADPEQWWAILDDVITPLDAQQLRGQCRRTLESYPEDPGVLALQGLAHALLPQPDWPTVASDFRACVGSLQRSYGWDRERIAAVRGGILGRLGARRPDAVDVAVRDLLRGDAIEATEWRRAAYPYVQDMALRRLCAVPYLETIRASLAQHYHTQLEA